jgi:hypothetical protein
MDAEQIPFELERDVTRPRREVSFAAFAGGKVVKEKKTRKKRAPIVGRVTATATSLTIDLDVPTKSEGNMRENRFAVANRQKMQRETVGREVTRALGGDDEDVAAVAIRRTGAQKRRELGYFGEAVDAMLERQRRLGIPWIPGVVTLTRVSARGLDDDNLQARSRACGTASRLRSPLTIATVTACGTSTPRT